MKTESETTGTAAKVSRWKHIDSLRGLAALYVVFHHALLYVNDDLPPGMTRRLLRTLLFGHYAVVVFIVLSGFCLMLPVVRNRGEIAGGTWHFIKKRAWRILPPYYFAISLSMAAIWLMIGVPTGTTWDVSIPVSMNDLLCHVVLIQDWFQVISHKINYPLWSISVEWRIYFIFPFLVYCWKRFGGPRTTAVTVLVSVLLLFPFDRTYLNTSVNGMCLHYYGLFAMGMLAAGIVGSHDGSMNGWRSRIPWTPALALAVLFIALYPKLEFWWRWELPWQFLDLLMGISAMCFLVVVVSNGGSDRFRRAREMLNWPPLVAIGAFSYSLYLVHAPLLQMTWQYFVEPAHATPLVSFAIMALMGIPATICFSYVFHLLCERPFMPGFRNGERRAEDGVGALLFKRARD